MQEARQEAQPVPSVGVLAFRQAAQHDHIAILHAYLRFQLPLGQRGRVVDASCRLHEVGKLLRDVQVDDTFLHHWPNVEDDPGAAVFNGLHGLPGTLRVRQSTQYRHILAHREDAL